jgi:type II secretory pathway predicted ATPase ExeA
MFLEHHGLIEEPFGVTPDPRFLYLGSKHREALASLLYGTEANRGFLALIAKPGMGKTSLLFQYLEHLRDKARTAFVFQTDCNSREFIRHILIDLGLDASGKDLPEMHEMLNQLLTEEMRAGRRFILVIDEAQNLKEKVLESVRLLSNFETPWMKLMQIVIAGQPQLAKRLARSSLAQLRQRISLVIRIEPFMPEEINAYIDHRLWVAGYQGPSLFTAGARLMIAEHSEGIPRNINNICFNAMSIACALKRKTIDRDIMREVLADLDLESLNEETAVARKSEQEPKHSVSQTPGNVEPKSRFRDWSPRFAVAIAILLALSLSVFQGNRKEGQVAAAPVLLPAETSSIAPTAGPASLDSTSRAAPNVSLTGQGAKAHPDHKNQVLLPQYKGTQSGAPAKHTIEQYRSIIVMPGQTLFQISVKYFRKYNREILEEIHELNPSLTNPDYIRSGREIRIPSVKEDSGDTHPAAKQGSHTASGRVEKP